MVMEYEAKQLEVYIFTGSHTLPSAATVPGSHASNRPEAEH